MSTDKNWRPISRWTLLVSGCCGATVLIAGAVARNLDLALTGIFVAVIGLVSGALYHWFVEGMTWLVNKLFSNGRNR